MKHFFLSFLLLGCAAKSPPSNPTAQQKQLAENLGNNQILSKASTKKNNNPKVKAAPHIQKILDDMIAKSTIDVVFTKLTRTTTSQLIQLQGTAKDNQSISVLLKALEKHPQFNTVYLISIKATTVHDKPRKIFTISGKFQHK